MRLVWPLGLAAVLGLILLIAPGHAASRLVEVNGGSVRLRELLPVGKLPPRAAEAVIAEGLRPGETRHLTAAEVKLRLAELGVEEAVSLDASIAVRRRARTLLARELVSAGEK